VREPGKYLSRMAFLDLSTAKVTSLCSKVTDLCLVPLVLQGRGPRRDGVAVALAGPFAGKVTFLCAKAAKVAALCHAKGRARCRFPTAPRC
jgi:hypothetical protein